MIHPTGPPRILVAGDSAEEVAQIVATLGAQFDGVRASANPDLIVEEFEGQPPDVLVLAFDVLDRAQKYYVALYRQGAGLPRNSHRTVVLCSRDEVEATAELCRKEYFDDYVLYWPHRHDGPRLVTSVRIACREIQALRSSSTRPVDLLAHARHVDELDRILATELSDPQHAADALLSIEAVERQVAAAIDQFSDRLSGGGRAGVEVTDMGAFAREIIQLKHQQVDLARRCGEIGIDASHASARRLKDRLDPALAGTRALVEEVRKIRPMVMVVEDDEFARQLVSRTLDPQSWETIFVTDGIQALNQLRRMRPDIILMDIGLPGIDGVSLTQQLKASAHLAAIPVIIMTSDARRETLASSVAAGASGFVVKPFSRELLTAKLERVLAL